MNELLATLDLSGWKPLITACLLPPIPWLGLAFWGVLLTWRRRRLGPVLTALAGAGIWLSSTPVAAEWLRDSVLQPPSALSAGQIARLRERASHGERLAVIALGSGRQRWTAEYGGPNLSAESLERLRYALWLGRQTGIPVGFSGGVGYGQAGDDAPEAGLAASAAAAEFHQPLRWVEPHSRDTRENARQTWALLQPAGVTSIVIVTHGWHMPRALRDFQRAMGDSVHPAALIAAPINLAPEDVRQVLRWLPSNEGFRLFRQSLREWLGSIAGA